MIQKFSILKILDNSGSKKAKCIHLYKGYRRRYSGVGDLIKVSLLEAKLLKLKKIKLKKSQLSKAIIIQTKTGIINYSGYSLFFKVNGIALINDRQKLIATKIHTAVLEYFRRTRYLRLVLQGAGEIN